MKRSYEETNAPQNTAEDDEQKALQKCYLLQKMNYHVSQLPGAPRCPDAPLPLPTLTLPVQPENTSPTTDTPKKLKQ